MRQTDDVFVVAQADGQPLKPISLTHEFVRFIAASGLPKICFHDLRHSHATDLLASGVHPDCPRGLGHATVAVTLDLYSHVYRACRRMQHPALTKPCSKRYTTIAALQKGSNPVASCLVRADRKPIY